MALGNNRCLQLTGDEGASTVEFALSASIFLMLLIGIMQIGLAIYTNHIVSEAAQDVARYAIVHGNTCLLNGASCTATTAQLQTYAQSLAYLGIDPANLNVTASYSANPLGGSCTPNANCANPGNMVTVTVNYAFPLNIPFIPASTLNLSSSSALLISQ